MSVALPHWVFRLREQAFLLRQRRRVQRLHALHRPPPNPAALLIAVRGKTLVLTVTAGRTGTTFLTHLLALCPDTTSTHEPEPSFVPVLRLAQHDPELGRRFLLEYKLPHIATLPTRRYVETGHLWCKGFLEPLLALDVVPRVVALRRAPRRIAASLLSRRTVPGRGKLGLKYLLHPDDPGVLPLPGWTAYSDYQLCFWYALEIERRTAAYQPLIERAGGAWVDVTAEELHDADRFLAAADTLGLLDPDTDRAALRAAHARVAGVTHNPNAEAVAVPDATAQEAAVWDAVAVPALRAALDARFS
ncbi:MAG: hypothetical protein SF182_01745 [Deltaproteobacteria bacterium]|nr:hypothetical protein [Deltaproteobacteria bacterium]